MKSGNPGSWGWRISDPLPKADILPLEGACLERVGEGSLDFAGSFPLLHTAFGKPSPAPDARATTKASWKRQILGVPLQSRGFTQKELKVKGGEGLNPLDSRVGLC
jgi:hypothetical protein